MKRMGLRLLTKMAWRNLWRQRRRTIITLFAMAAGLAFSIPTYGLMMGLRAQMIDGITGMHLGNIQIHQKDYPEERRMRQMLSLAEVQKGMADVDGIVAAAPRAYSGGMVSSERKVPIHLLGLPEAELKKIKLLNGAPPKRSDPCTAIIDRVTSKTFKIRKGSTVMLAPLPPEGGCERVTISGVTASRKGQGATVYMATTSVQKILAKPAVPAKSARPADDDDDDDDIDNLAKLGDTPTTDSTRVTVAPVSPPTTGPTSGDYHLLKLYSQPVGIIAINPDDERKVSTMSKGIIGGRYLASTYHLEEGTRGVIAEVVIGEKLAKILKAGVGDVIGMDMGTVHNYALDRMFKVVGIFKTGLSDLDRGVVYIHIQNAWDKGLMGLVTPKTGKPAIHEMALRLKKSLSGAPIAAKIRSQMNSNAVVRTWQQIEPSMANILKTQEAMTGLILAIILLIASFGTMNTMLMAVMERIKEFGVLKSIGMKPSWVGILIMTETFFLALTASVLGGLLGIGMQALLVRDGIDLTFVMPDGFTFQGVIIDPVWRAAFTLRGVLVPVVLLFTISLIVAVWPALRASRIKPVEAFRNQG